jgi:hypothetical protein
MDDALLQHVIALLLNLILQQLRVAIWSKCHRWCTWQQPYAVIVATRWGKTVRFCEDVDVGFKEGCQ